MEQKNLFDTVSTSIFKNLDYVEPHFHPPDLPHREDQINELVSSIGPFIKAGGRPMNIIIHGFPSQGKTAVVMKVIKDLNIWVEKNNFPVKIFLVRCRDLKSYTLQALLDEFLFQTTGKRRSRAALSYVMSLFIEEIDKLKSTIIFIIDDIHRIKLEERDTMFFFLSRIGADLKYSRFSFVGISNDPKLLNDIRSETLSGLFHSVILFDAYTPQEIFDILKYRADFAFNEGAIDNDLISYVTKLSFVHSRSDVRYGLQLLKEAGKIAEGKNEKKLTPEMINRAKNRLQEDVFSTMIKGIGTTSHIILGTVYYLKQKEKEKNLISGDIYSFSKKITNGNIDINMPLVSRILTSLYQEHRLIELIPVKGRGQTRAIDIEEDPKDIRERLKDVSDSIRIHLNDSKEAKEFYSWLIG